jgi:hypothetical protein
MESGGPFFMLRTVVLTVGNNPYSRPVCRPGNGVFS